MSNKVNLTEKEVLHVAELANLKLNPEELISFKSQLIETVSYVKNLDELDTSNTQPTSHSTEAENVFFEDGSTNHRSFSQEEAISQAKVSKNKQFVVNRVL